MNRCSDARELRHASHVMLSVWGRADNDDSAHCVACWHPHGAGGKAGPGGNTVLGDVSPRGGSALGCSDAASVVAAPSRGVLASQASTCETSAVFPRAR